MPDGPVAGNAETRVREAREIDGIYLLFLGRRAEDDSVRAEHFGRSALEIAEEMIASAEFGEQVLGRLLADGTLPHDERCAADLRLAIEIAGETGLAVLALSDFGSEIHFAIDLAPLEGAAFAAGAHRMILGREADREEVETCLERLRAGTAAKREMAEELLASEEFRDAGRAVRMIGEKRRDISAVFPIGGAALPFAWRPVLHRVFTQGPAGRIITERHGAAGKWFVTALDPNPPRLRLRLGAPHPLGAPGEYRRGARLLIEGWALARDGIAAAEIAVAGRRIREARRGVPRPEIAAACPDWPEAGKAGFAAVVPFWELPAEAGAAQILLRDAAGGTATAELFFAAAEPDRTPVARSADDPYERAVLQRIVAGLDQHPLFCPMLVIESDEGGIATARGSLRALCEQSYPDWRAVIFVRDDGATAALLRERLLSGACDIAGLRDLVVVGTADRESLCASLLDGFEEIEERVELVAGGGPAALADLVCRRAAGRPGFALPLTAGVALGRDALLELAVAGGIEGESDLISSGAGEEELELACLGVDVLRRTGARLDDLLQFGPRVLAEYCAVEARAAQRVPFRLSAPARALEEERETRDIEAEIRAIRESGLFEEVYYRANNPDVVSAGTDLLRHFVESGAWEGRKPNRLFDPGYYLRENPDIRGSGEHPLVHFIRRGAAEGRRPSAFFDPAFYRERYEDVAQSETNPLRHYLERGEAEGRRPAALDYQDWCRLYDALSEDDREAIGAHLAGFAWRPLVSLGMRVGGASAGLLYRAIGSVRRQLYPDWELWVGRERDAAEAVCRVLDELGAVDPRIRIVELPDGAGAAGLALAEAAGEFIAWIGEGDELAETALYLIAEELNRHPDADILYSDEDRISRTGQRREPHFKPDWNPDLFYGWDYIGGLRVFRTSRAREAGGVRRDFEGALFYDLTLRIIERTEESRIRHVPFVLYHRCAADAPTAGAAEAPGCGATAARRALSDHFFRIGRRDVEVVAGRLPHHHRVVWPLPNPPPRVSLVIPTGGGKLDVLDTCVSGLLERTGYANLELIILDNTKGEDEALSYFETISADPRVTIVDAKGPFNFSRICNLGVERGHGEVIGLVNDDIQVIDPGWLREMVSHALRPEVGAVGAMLYYPDETIQHAGMIFGLRDGTEHIQRRLPRGAPGYFGRALLTQDLSCVTAACLVMRRAVYHEVGGLDEKLAFDFNDVDLCIKIRDKGYRIVWTPFAELYHLESATRGYPDTLEKLRRLGAETRRIREKWGTRVFSDDPYFNPNLCRDAEDFEIGGVPRVAKPWLPQRLRARTE